MAQLKGRCRDTAVFHLWKEGPECNRPLFSLQSEQHLNGVWAYTPDEDVLYGSMEPSPAKGQKKCLIIKHKDLSILRLEAPFSCKSEGFYVI